MPITVNTIIEKLKPFSAVTFPTLGGTSTFDVVISNDGIVSIINSGNNIYILNDDWQIQVISATGRKIKVLRQSFWRKSHAGF